MPDEARLSVSWKAVSIGAVIVALTSMTIAAIVVTIKNADTLSVVALGLAVIAFIIQIIVYIVQTAAASQQELRAHEVYASTLKLLAKIEAKAEGTERTVTTINERMLGALLNKALPEARSSGISPSSPEFGDAIAERVARLARDFTPVPSGRTPQSARDRGPALSSSIIDEAPKVDELQQAIQALKSLTSEALEDIANLGDDFARFNDGPDGVEPGLQVIQQGEELYRKNLVKRVQKNWSDEPVFVLTPKGMIAARTLLAPNIPEEFEPEVAELRSRLRDEQRRTQVLLDADPSPRIPVDDD